MKKPKLEGTMQYTAIDYSDANHQWNITMTGSEWPWMMKLAKPSIHCPYCQTTKIKKNGINYKQKQQYRCLNTNCLRHF